MRVRFIVPSFNAQSNMKSLSESFCKQSTTDFDVTIIDDMSDTPMTLDDKFVDARFRIIHNDVKKYALRNIVETVKNDCEDDDIVAIVDGDDALCNDSTVHILQQAYNNDVDVVWTAHKWDVNGINISSEMPQNVNPYYYRWCSSHLKTFRASALKSIPDVNFKDHNGEWFTRAYDQALMLPLLYKAKNKRLYVKDVCYDYRIKSCSIPNRELADANKQLQIVNFVRARGYVND